MRKKICIVIIFYVIVGLLAGCETVAGSAKGAQKDLEPATHEAQKNYKKLQKVDDQMQQNLW